MISKYVKKYRQFVAYTICGSMATVVNLSAYFYFNRIIGISAMYSNAIAWLLSVLFAYITNKVFVFKSRLYQIVDIVKEFISFILARLSSGLIDMLLLWVGIYFLHVYDVFVKIFIAVIVIVMNYIFSKFFVFKSAKIIGQMEEIETDLIETIELDIIERLDIIKDHSKRQEAIK